MISLTDEYRDTIRKYLEGNASLDALIRDLMIKFKNESRYMSDDNFDILDTIFGYLDSVSNDIELIRQNPKFYITEDELRKKLESASARLL